MKILWPSLGQVVGLFDKRSIRASFKFLLPSLIYAVNNNIYLAGLILVPPPIWIILCSFSCHCLPLQVHPQERCLPPSAPWIFPHRGQYFHG